MDNNIFNTKMDELLNFGSLEDLEKEMDKLNIQISTIEKKKEDAGDLNAKLAKIEEELHINTALLRADKLKSKDLNIYELSKEYMELHDLQKEIESLSIIKGKSRILNKAKELWDEKLKEKEALNDAIKEVESAIQKVQKELYDLGNKVINKDFDFVDFDRMEELQRNIIPSLETKLDNLKKNNDQIKADGILPADIKEQVKEYMLNIVAKTHKNVVNIKFIIDKEKGISNSQMFIKMGTTLEVPVAPVLDENHEFECWLLNGEPFDFTKPLTQDIILEAKYRELNKNKFVVVTLVTDKTKPYSNVDTFCEKGKEFKKPVDPVLDENYEFECWLLNGEPFDFTKPVTENIVLEAKYREKQRKVVTVTFKTNNNSEKVNIAETFLMSGELLERPEDPVLDANHEFECWLLDGEPFDFSIPVTENMVLEAKYKIKGFEGAKVVVGFNLHNGKNSNQEYNPIILNRGDILKSIESPVLDENHEFECWLLDGEPFDLNTPITEDIVLEAKYKELKKDDEMVTISFKLNNGINPNATYEDVKIPKGTLVNKPEDPIFIDDEGNVYDLDYWMVDKERFWFNTIIDNDIVLEAKYKEQPRKEFEIKFNLANGGHDKFSFDPVIVRDGELLDRPAEDPVLDDDHVFDCWMLDGEPYDFTKPVTNNMVLTAKYKSRKETCQVTFKNKKGKELKTVEVRVGEKLKSEDMPKPKHKMLNLSSWKVGEKTFDLDTVVTEDIVVMASYKKDWKKIAAIGAGVAAGVVVKTFDTVMFNEPGTFSVASTGVNLIASRITTKKIKNHKPVDTTVETLKGIKKAKSKLVNHFRNEENLKALRTFFRTAAATSAISAASEFVIDENVVIPSEVAESHYVPVSEPETVNLGVTFDEGGFRR